MNKQEIQELAENALHEACRHIQDALGVTTGDIFNHPFTKGRTGKLIAN